jgi:hypothetical protein
MDEADNKLVKWARQPRNLLMLAAGLFCLNCLVRAAQLRSVLGLQAKIGASIISPEFSASWIWFVARHPLILLALSVIAIAIAAAYIRFTESRRGR